MARGVGVVMIPKPRHAAVEEVVERVLGVGVMVLVLLLLLVLSEENSLL